MRRHTEVRKGGRKKELPDLVLIEFWARNYSRNWPMNNQPASTHLYPNRTSLLTCHCLAAVNW